MIKVIHVLPRRLIGGAEAAVRCVADSTPGGTNCDVRMYFIGGGFDWSDAKQPSRWNLFNPLNHLLAAFRIISSKPDVVVFSLWWTVPTLFIMRLIGFTGRSVIFCHSSRYKHKIDEVFYRLACRRVDAIWCDSVATMHARMLDIGDAKLACVVPTIPDWRKGYVGDKRRCRGYFIYWGRLAPEKNIVYTVKIIAAMVERGVCSRFDIVGPDGGALGDIQSIIKRLNLERVVFLHGEASPDQIIDIAERSEVFISSSLREGQAMSVIEAMQLGLIPIVSPVGEIPSYAKDGENAIHIDLRKTPSENAENISRLLLNDERRSDMRDRSLAHWQKQPVYVDAYAAEIHKLCLRKGGLQ